MRKKYKIDESYFDNINTEDKAYFLGMMYADGCNQRSRFNITLAKKDSYLLEQFAKFLQTDKPVDFPNKTNVAKIDICSSKMCRKLSSLGCVPRKSKIITFPKFLPSELVNHFIRGYFDGDGSLTKCNTTWNIYIAGTLDFCNGISSSIDFLKLEPLIFPHKSNSIYYFSISGEKRVTEFMEYMYRGSTIFMERKKEKYNEMLLYYRYLRENSHLNKHNRYIDEDKIIELHNKGYMPKEIADELKCKYETIRKKIPQMGLSRNYITMKELANKLNVDYLRLKYLVYRIILMDICLACGKDFTKNVYNQLCCNEECSKEYQRQKRIENRDKRIAYGREYRRKNKEKCAAYGKEYRKKHPKEKVDMSAVCVICGEDFIKNVHNQLCCKEECVQERKRRWHYDYNQERYYNNDEYKQSVKDRALKYRKTSKGRAWARKHYKENKDDINRKKREHRAKNRDQYIERRRKWLEKDENRESVRASGRKWARNNPDKVNALRESGKQKRRIYTNNRRKTDAMFRLNLNMGAAIRKDLKNNKINKNRRHWEDLVSFNKEQLKDHLESLFTEGMSWDKFLKGEIEIDHIIPKAFFKYTSTDDVEFKYCWSLDNLQPLWAEDNYKKKNHVPGFKIVKWEYVTI
jgi:hypothetical protein